MYDFETLVNRSNQGALKWLILTEEDKKNGVIPYSVADMEFKIAPEIIEGLKAHLDSDILGYTGPTQEYFDSITSYMQRHHGIHLEANTIIQTPGVVTALGCGVKAFTEEGDEIVILRPVYYPFSMVIENNNRVLVNSELQLVDGKYTIDFEDLEKKLSSPKAKLMIFCSPHNPVGRVWKEEEVKKIVELCAKHGVYLISDEIHMDLVMPGYKHYSAALFEEYKNNLMLCTSCSKTFNLAGMQVSNIIIFDDKKREKMQAILQGMHIGMLNNLAYEACILAYTKGDAWLKEMLAKINENRLLVKEYIEKNLPMIDVIELEGTYLQWLDLRALKLSDEELEKLMKKHSLYLDEGYIFGNGGSGFERINLACPTHKIQEFLDRLDKAVKEVVNE